MKNKLKCIGNLFPTTEDEVEAFEKEHDIDSIILPEILQDLLAILKKGRVTHMKKKDETK